MSILSKRPHTWRRQGSSKVANKAGPYYCTVCRLTWEYAPPKRSYDYYDHGMPANWEHKTCPKCEGNDD